jgi:adenosylcobinamide amidohydrolase
MRPLLCAARETLALAVTRGERSLVARFAGPQRVCSWAIVNGGLRRADAVAWIEVSDSELCPPVDARTLLRQRLVAAGAPAAVGLLTSRRLDAAVDVTRHDGDATSRCIATVGLGNALRAGDPRGPAARIGTINLLCHVDVPLTDEAILEAMSIAAEARTAAILEARVASRRSGLPATGTGTDCIALASPLPSRGRGGAAPYAGKHTRVGYLVGAAVIEAVSLGARAWKRERGEA